MGIGMCSSKRLVHQPGLKPASGKYATRATDTDFDNKTNITVLQFLYVDTTEGQDCQIDPDSGAATFSMCDGTDGIYLLQAGSATSVSAYVVTKGASDFSNELPGAPFCSEWAGTSGTQQENGICGAIAYTFNASLSEDENKIFRYTIKTGKSSNAFDNSESNLGAIGTSTAIRLGNLSTNGSNVSYQMTAGAKIGKTAMWFSTLSEANIDALVNYTATGSMIYDVAGRYGASGYTNLGIAQPNHEWIPKLDGTILDTGSDGGKDLTIQGSAKIATFGAY